MTRALAAVSVAFAAAAAFATVPSHWARAETRPTKATTAKPMLPPSPSAWRDSGNDGIRGITVGPIENMYHPGKGYGSPAFVRTIEESKKQGATWIALTPFGRVFDLKGRGIDPTFEVPFERNRNDVRQAIAIAHAAGLRVMLVPHLWIESGEWRALVDPGTDEGWSRWAESYGAFVKRWAALAEESHVDLLSVGVELRSWVTTARAPSFSRIVKDVRATYHGLLTYSANWDDVDDTIILGDVDLIGINAFYPLTDKENASPEELEKGGERVREKIEKLSATWQKPVLFTEIGYTTRPDPALRPWEWPDAMKNVTVDPIAQAAAYRGLLAPVLRSSSFAGFFVWRVYADPDDVSQEAEWGFSPRGKLAELVMRDAFAARWASDATTRFGIAPRARIPGLFP